MEHWGTSQAAPHVTGAVALLLAQNPALTADEVKAALHSARTDFFTGATPNNIWSFGRLAVDLAINAVLPKVAVPNVVGLTQADATTAITVANLAVGTVTEASSTTVPKGPDGGTLVFQGAVVNLAVSCRTSVPDVKPGLELVPTWFQRRAEKPAFFRYKRCRFNGF